MNSQLHPDFLACFAKLPNEVKEQARRCYRIWQENNSHPGLQFKPLQGHDDLYSVRIGLRWRALGLVEGDTVTWFWIGSHADYDKLVG